MIESFAELFEASVKGGQSMQPGTIVNAIVLAVKPDVVIVDAGLKSEGVIPLSEFMVDGEIKVAVGDQVEVALETVEDLRSHDCIVFTQFAKPREWKLLGPDGPVNVPISGRVATNNAANWLQQRFAGTAPTSNCGLF